ncbi:hypothetical protein [Bradyrhizobium sp.]|uniref:hypothetical protein n=1 Tax=Bradyrhizobium sp. TaxID=376 RepID=UPI003C4CFCDC
MPIDRCNPNVIEKQQASRNIAAHFQTKDTGDGCFQEMIAADNALHDEHGNAGVIALLYQILVGGQLAELAGEKPDRQSTAANALETSMQQFCLCRTSRQCPLELRLK